MNEVEKVYRNSGIKKIELDYPDNFEPFYPEFTAEKQLELIKWLVHKSILSITIASNNDYHVCGFGWTGDFKADFNEVS
jgi:hypothetical protein